METLLAQLPSLTFHYWRLENVKIGFSSGVYNFGNSGILVEEQFPSHYKQKKMQRRIVKLAYTPHLKPPIQRSNPLSSSTCLVELCAWVGGINLEPQASQRSNRQQNFVQSSSHLGGSNELPLEFPSASHTEGSRWITDFCTSEGMDTMHVSEDFFWLQISFLLFLQEVELQDFGGVARLHPSG